MAQRRWTSTIPQIASEDVIALGDGRYAHFRRDRRFAQVQVVFTAPQGVDPNPGQELTGQFRDSGWTWRGQEPGKPWVYQLDRSSRDDPNARGDSRDALHEQFLLIIQEYRQKHGLPPVGGWDSLANDDPQTGHADECCTSGSSLAGQPIGAGEKQKAPSAKAETRGGGEGASPLPGQAMLDAFASVGAERFDLTITDAAGEKVEFRGNRTLDLLRQALPAILQAAEERRRNVIVRPRPAAPTLIQLDDLSEAAVELLRSVAFLALRTSLGSYQVWLAVADAEAELARRLKQGAGADPTASGATRVSGSLNVKEKHAPAFPRVETVHASPGRVATRAEVEALGVVAVPATPAPPIRGPRRQPGARGWPSYRRCLEQAPRRGGERPDRSRADYTFCLMALDWGWSVEETAARLLQESGKAQENGEAYALRTARNAAAAIERREGKQR